MSEGIDGFLKIAHLKDVAWLASNNVYTDAVGYISAFKCKIDIPHPVEGLYSKTVYPQRRHASPRLNLHP